MRSCADCTEVLSVNGQDPVAELHGGESEAERFLVIQ